MDSLADSIEWTDRADVCRRLADFVARSPREDGVWLRRRNHFLCRLPSQREQAIRLLCHLARPEDAVALASIAGDLTESFEVREMVYPHLVSLGGELPAEAFVDEDMDLCFHDQHHSQDAAKFLLLFRRSISLDRLDAFIGSSRTNHAEVLAILAGEPLTPPEWLDWLYEQWLSREAQSAVEPVLWTESGKKSIDATIAYHFRDRPEAAELLRRYRTGHLSDAYVPTQRLHPDRRWEFDWDSLASGLWRDETELLEAVNQAPDDFRMLAESLCLPISALETYWSRDEVLNRIETAFRTLALTEHGAFPYDRNHLLKLAYLFPSQEVEERLTNLYLCPETPSAVRSEVYNVLWVRAWKWTPDLARSSVREWPKKDFSFWRKGEALLRLSESPQKEDRPFFLWAAGAEKRPEFRFLGIRALSHLGEDTSEWRLRLDDLRRDSDRDVRLAAAVALLRLGEERQRKLLVDAALNAKDAITQRHGLEALGEIEGEDHLHVFAHVLGTRPTLKWSHERIGVFPYATLEAARQLAEIGTPESLTELLRGCLRGAETNRLGDRCAVFAVAVRRWEGESVELPEKLYWRWERDWEWRCA